MSEHIDYEAEVKKVCPDADCITFSGHNIALEWTSQCMIFEDPDFNTSVIGTGDTASEAWQSAYNKLKITA